MGKPTICIGENKDPDQLRRKRKADQRLCFRYMDSTIPLLSKSKIASCACTAQFVSDMVRTQVVGFLMHMLISSPEPLGSPGELIYRMAMIQRPSVRRRPPFSKIFFSETAWPIKAKFYMKHLLEGGTNVFYK